MSGQFGNAVVGGERLNQKMRNSGIQKDFCLTDIVFRAAQGAILRRRADIAEYIGVIGPGSR